VAALLPFHLHPFVVAVIVAAAVVHHVLVTSPRQRVMARCALLALLLVTIWPVGDVAAKVSLSVATAQRLVIMLLVAPLLLLSLPTATLARLSRPPLVDFVVRKLAHPGLALATVTLVGTATLMPPVVDWGARSNAARDLVLAVVLAVGVVLWIPALAVMPGTRRLSPMARAGYLFAASLAVTSLSFVWIFARHPLYPGLHGQDALLGVTPLFDQQLAGFVAKFACYVPLWWVAFVIFAHAEDRGVAVEETPLHWADVERELLRLDRRRSRLLARHRPS